MRRHSPFASYLLVAVIIFVYGMAILIPLLGCSQPERPVCNASPPELWAATPTGVMAKGGGCDCHIGVNP